MRAEDAVDEIRPVTARRPNCDGEMGIIRVTPLHEQLHAARLWLIALGFLRFSVNRACPMLARSGYLDVGRTFYEWAASDTRRGKLSPEGIGGFRLPESANAGT